MMAVCQPGVALGDLSQSVSVAATAAEFLRTFPDLNRKCERWRSSDIVIVRSNGVRKHPPVSD